MQSVNQYLITSSGISVNAVWHYELQGCPAYWNGLYEYL